MYSALFSMFFFVTLYLQQVLGDDALAAGLSFLPITLSVFTGSTFAPRLVARIGLRGTVTVGMLLGAAALLLLTGVTPGGSYVTAVLPDGILAGLGMGMGIALVSSTIAATRGVSREQSGLACGLRNTSRLFGGALGLAVLSTIAASATHAAVGVSTSTALIDGFARAFTVGSLPCLAGAVVALLALREPISAAVVAEVGSEPELEEREALAA
jgi:Na+/melibiose symporter-like transporter